VISAYWRRVLVELYGERPDKIGVITNGIDLRRFDPTRCSPGQPVEVVRRVLGEHLERAGVAAQLSETASNTMVPGKLILISCAGMPSSSRDSSVCRW